MGRKIGDEIVFKHYPDFRPTLTPKEVISMGAFGGTYFRKIHSTITKKDYSARYYKKYKSFNSISADKLTKDTYDKSINRYGVKCGTSLEFWESKGWITKFHPYGWFEWYTDFYEGNLNDPKYHQENLRQINRWKRTGSKNSRFRGQLEKIAKNKGVRVSHESVSPKIKQVLLHWASYTP